MKTVTLTILLVITIAVGSGCNSQIDRGQYPKKSESTAMYDSTQISEPTDRQKQRKWKKGYVYVTKVVDGDTFWVDNGSEPIKVRFIGIDAPETRNTGRKKKGYYGNEAKAHVKALTEHQWVRLELDVQEKDRYHRLLAYVYLEDGTFLNARLVADGYAVVATFPPNVKYVDLFTDLQRQARNGKHGLWAIEPVYGFP